MEKNFSWYTLLVVCVACFLATSVEIPLSWTSPMYPKLYSNDSSVNPLDRPITKDEDAWLGSLLTVGAVIGPFPFSFVTEKFGRKIGLLATSVPIMISYFTSAFATNLAVFYLARVFAGLSMGAGYALLPVYISEISEDHNRGRLSQALNIFWSLGSFLCYAIGPFISIQTFNIILGCIPTIFFISFFLLAPESPYYLVTQNKIEKAKKSLFLLRGLNDEQLEEEIQKIKSNIKKEESVSVKEILTNRAIIKAFVICAVLIISQELVGFVAILFYMQMIFDAAGTKLASDISSLIVAVFILTSSFVNQFFVDRTGRRFLTIVSCIGMFIALLLLGAFFFVQAQNMDVEPIFWLPLVSLILYIFSFNFGISSIPWTMTSELFPTNVKNVASNVISIICWATSFLVTKFFNSMTEGIGHYGSFWTFGGVCFLATIFSIFFVPETKGKSFSDIQEMLLSKKIVHAGCCKKKNEPVVINALKIGEKGKENGAT